MMRATLQATWDGILVTDEHGDVTGLQPKVRRDVAVASDVMARCEHRRILEHTGPASSTIRNAFLARVEEIYASSPAESLDVLELADGRVFERYSTDPARRAGGTSAASGAFATSPRAGAPKRRCATRAASSSC